MRLGNQRGHPQGYGETHDRGGRALPRPSQLRGSRLRLYQRRRTHRRRQGNVFHTTYTKFQRGNSECGMYVLYILISLLEGKISPEQINKKRIPDSKMLALRKVLFN